MTPAEHDPNETAPTGQPQPDDRTIRAPSARDAPDPSRIDDGRYTPGTLLDDRYRIVARLGKGGMGEVYRADDLKLGVSVALKFLPEHLANDPKWLRRFHDEVRIAREVAHPNVCRTYDIGEVEGEHYITMEYVDGEDLGILLRRIGRLPKDKAIEIARQLCAGLAAAHDKGVLHRDLKPANVMLDGRGNARITDFGIAALTEELEQQDVKAGTPAYMAPEQLAGESVSVRSDIYSLGLVLYEIFTGREAYHADSAAELQSMRGTSAPSAPSSYIEDMDPLVERVILRCLEHEPARRPGSVIAVAAALPGGDPLAMALAAGETPSPEMVAQSGASGALRPRVAMSCLVIFVLGVVVAIFMRDRLGLLPAIPFEKPPAVLTHRAIEIAADLGYTERPGDQAAWFTDHTAYTQHVRDTDDSPERWDRLATGRPPSLLFLIRTSPEPMASRRPGARVTWSNPPFDAAGMMRMSLDPEGRLLSLEAVPARQRPLSDDAESNNQVVSDWAALFAAAELDLQDFEPAEPIWTPTTYCDERAAWLGTWPTAPEETLRVEAGAFDGRPVFFRLYSTWDAPSDEPPVTAQRVINRIVTGVFIAVFATVVLLAFRNLRAGRVDRRGAWRLALYVVCIMMGEWAFKADHVADLDQFFIALFISIGLGGLIWTFYLVVEPYARRYWPHSIISWTRLLAGRVRDPLVGRDLLFGCVAGSVIAVGRMLLTLATNVLDANPKAPPTEIDLDALLGARRVVALLFGAQTSMTNWLFLFVFLLLLRIVFRRGWLAVTVFCLLLMTAFTNAFTAHPVEEASTWIAAIGITTILIVTMVRLGLLSLLSMSLTASLLVNLPATFDMTRWYAGIGMIGPLVALALAAYGFWVSLAGQPLFKDDLAR